MQLLTIRITCYRAIDDAGISDQYWTSLSQTKKKNFVRENKWQEIVEANSFVWEILPYPFDALVESLHGAGTYILRDRQVAVSDLSSICLPNIGTNRTLTREIRWRWTRWLLLPEGENKYWFSSIGNSLRKLETVQAYNSNQYWKKNGQRSGSDAYP